MERNIEVILCSSLEKVFLDEAPHGDPQQASMLRNEEFSYQIAYTQHATDDTKLLLTLTVDSPLEEFITVRQVEHVPCQLAVFSNADDYYLRKTPGLYPDPLTVLPTNNVEAVRSVWNSLWITIKPQGKAEAGVYPVRITLENERLSIQQCTEFTVEIIDADLPEQKLIFTQWLHADCIAVHHQVEIFGEEHWALLGSYIQTAVQNGMNMLYTPIFTPPLDTAVGGERPTVQLVGVQKEAEHYAFDFTRLTRWVRLAEQLGIRFFEMSHLFTQWGAEHAPKVMARVDGTEQKLFGWETDATGAAYSGFLRQMLPALVAHLKYLGIADRCYFHISDEPGSKSIVQYAKASKLVLSCIEDCKLIDALSDYQFYEQGLVQTPIPPTSHLQPFLDHGVSPLWTYYCCTEGNKVGNRFFSMPSARNRILGVQLYQFGITGFLHWGYNFYYSQYALQPIHPFFTTDALCGFPSGDAFSVYPTENGVIESLRLKVFHDALQDMRAFELLESFVGKQEVIRLIEESAAQPVTFEEYPHDDAFLPQLREKVNRKIAQCMGLDQ